MNFDNFKARCSAISMVTSENKGFQSLTEKQVEKIAELEGKESLTEKQAQELALLIAKGEKSKEVMLSEGYISYLMEEYAWRKDQMLAVTKELDTHQIQKGKLVEKESVMLLREVDGIDYQYNEEKVRVENEYLSGEVDVWVGKSIMEAEIIVDTKNIWDYIGYLVKTTKPLLSANKQQVQGYLNITNSPIGYIADCLMDTPDSIKEGIYKKLLRMGNYISEESPDFLFDWAMYDRSMTFSDKFTPSQRVNKKIVEPMTEHETQFLYDQVKRGRSFLNKLHEERSKLN